MVILGKDLAQPDHRRRPSEISRRGIMGYLTRRSCRAAVFVAVIATLSAAPVRANDITTEWATVKPPPVPELKPATVESKTTALLILDLMKTNCGVRPRCMATVPNVKKLLDAARANDMMVFY